MSQEAIHLRLEVGVKFSTLLVGFCQSLSKSLRESNVCVHRLQSSQANLAQLSYRRVDVFQKILLLSSSLTSLKKHQGHSQGFVDCVPQIIGQNTFVLLSRDCVCVSGCKVLWAGALSWHTYAYMKQSRRTPPYKQRGMAVYTGVKALTLPRPED